MPFCISIIATSAMNSSSKREERITAYVDPDTEQFVKRAAQREGRTVSSYVARVLRKEKEISGRGFGGDNSTRCVAAT